MACLDKQTNSAVPLSDVTPSTGEVGMLASACLYPLRLKQLVQRRLCPSPQQHVDTALSVCCLCCICAISPSVPKPAHMCVYVSVCVCFLFSQQIQLLIWSKHISDPCKGHESNCALQDWWHHLSCIAKRGCTESLIETDSSVPSDKQPGRHGVWMQMGYTCSETSSNLFVPRCFSFFFFFSNSQAVSRDEG